MDNAIYTNLTRQSGLLKELSVIANNMANINTVGFKREGAIFSEYIKSVGGLSADQTLRQSLSMGRLGGHYSKFTPGVLKQTGGSLDVAIEGDGFFMIATPAGQRLTRAGHFMTNNEGTLITPDGMAVLDDAGGEIQIPQETGTLAISGDGTISADGAELARLGVVGAPDESLVREGGNLWIATQGTQQVENSRVVQGFTEGSNVEPVSELARMIEVQRLYDAGQKLLDMENDRIRKVITTLRQLA